VADPLLPPDMQDDWADRTRLLLASHLHGGSRSAGDLFAGPWSGPVVRDATFAARSSTLPPPADLTNSQLADGEVVAVAVARDRGDVVIATTTRVLCWRPDDGSVLPVCSTTGQDVLGLSAGAAGEAVYVLSQAGDERLLRCYSGGGKRPFAPLGQAQVRGDGPFHLQPAAGGHGGTSIRVAGPGTHVRFIGRYLAAQSVTPPNGLATHLIVEKNAELWVWIGSYLNYQTAGSARWERRLMTWWPAVPHGSAVGVPPIDWLTPTPGVIEVVGLNQQGVLYWSSVTIRDTTDSPTETHANTHPSGYVAACLTGPGLVAAVSGNNVLHWLSADSGLAPRAKPRALAVPARAVWLVARPAAREVVVVFADGSTARVPMP
jgi:hypothetical protein